MVTVLSAFETHLHNEKVPTSEKIRLCKAGLPHARQHQSIPRRTEIAFPLGTPRKDTDGAGLRPGRRLNALARHVLEFHDTVEANSIHELVCRGCDNKAVVDTW